MTTEQGKLSAADWTAKLREQAVLTHAEKVALTDFLRESPTNVRELVEHTFIEQDLKALPIPPSDLDRWITAARSSVSGTIPFPERSAPHQHIENLPLPRTGQGLRLLAAASVAAVLAVGGLVLHSQIGLYKTGFGEQRTLSLADGSVVTLNTESQIKVEFSGDRRSIKLRKGEAFFRVAHDPGRPFLVDAQDAVVRAVGTQFNVRIAPHDTVVSVVDGVVRVSINGDASSASGAAASTVAQGDSSALSRDPLLITLNKGEEARIGRHTFTRGSTLPPVSKAESQSALRTAAWTQGRLEFDGAPLAEVLSEFQRYLQFDVEIGDDTTRELKLTGSFDARDPDSALAYIETIPGIAVEKKGPRSYYIYRR